MRTNIPKSRYGFMSRKPFSPLSKARCRMKLSCGRTSMTAGYFIYFLRLLQRLYLEWLFSVHHKIPVSHKFILMNSLVFSIINMKMRRRMFIRRKIHSNDYAIKHRDSRQGISRFTHCLSKLRFIFYMII